MKQHILKTDPAVFAAVLAGVKTHEIRFDDRGFAVGDSLLLNETRSTGAEMAAGAPLEYTGRAVTRTVSHIQTGYGLAGGWCILSFASAAPDKLPILPESVDQVRCMIRGERDYSEACDNYYTEEQMRAYARAAIRSEL